MEQDWDAVAKALKDRMTELGLRQQDLASRSDVGVSTIQELVNNWKPRRRNPKTLAALSSALEWPHDRLQMIAAARQEPPAEDEGAIAELRKRLTEAERRIALLEERVPEAPQRTS